MSLDAPSARRVAESLLASPQVGDDVARKVGHVVEPLELRGPAGEPGGWVVGVEADGRLLGFLQLQPDGRMRRYASLRERYGSADRCPATGDWLDPARATERAAREARADEHLQAPVLTWDRSPDRIVWEVPAVSDAGTRVFQVMGDYIGVRSGGSST